MQSNLTYADGMRDGREFASVKAYEREATARDGRTLHIVGRVSADYFRGLAAAGCNVR